MKTVGLMPRFRWPKALPTISAEQKRIHDDFMHYWHEVLPRRYGIVERFNHGFPLRHNDIPVGGRTLEIGAGLGEHLAYEDLDAQDYHCMELRESMVNQIRRQFPNVHAVTGDCQERLPFADGYFNRIVAIHVLEHLPDLPAAVGEMARVLSDDGACQIVIPCDPGLLYEFCRKISAERLFRKRYKQSYREFIRREHINSPAEVLGVVRRHFQIDTISYFPLAVPILNLNVCVGIVARKKVC